jgi:hypothetical protein
MHLNESGTIFYPTQPTSASSQLFSIKKVSDAAKIIHKNASAHLHAKLGGGTEFEKTICETKANWKRWTTILDQGMNPDPEIKNQTEKFQTKEKEDFIPLMEHLKTIGKYK